MPLGNIDFLSKIVKNTELELNEEALNCNEKITNFLSKIVMKKITELEVNEE